MSLSRGETLPNPQTTEFTRFIINATATQPAQWYKLITTPFPKWVNQTPQLASVEFAEYSAQDLVGAFETALT